MSIMKPSLEKKISSEKGLQVSTEQRKSLRNWIAEISPKGSFKMGTNSEREGNLATIKQEVLIYILIYIDMLRELLNGKGSSEKNRYCKTSEITTLSSTYEIQSRLSFPGLKINQSERRYLSRNAVGEETP